MLTFELIETSSLRIWDFGWFDASAFRALGQHDDEPLAILRDFIASPIFPRSFIEIPNPWGASLDRHGPVLVGSLFASAYRFISHEQLRVATEKILSNTDFRPELSSAQRRAVDAWLADVRASSVFRLNRRACSEVAWHGSWLLFEEFIAVELDSSTVRVAVFGFD